MNNNLEPISLLSLNALVRGLVEQGLPGNYWVVGELSEVRETTAGHCYIELIERSAAKNDLVAKARGTIWARIYSILKPYFLEQTGTSFAAGIKVLLCVKVVFHELYGFSLEVCDIDPTYTVGEMARLRQQIINRLASEGVLGLNKELPFPRLPRRVAVISSSFAAGYGDFCDQLATNPYGFIFYTHLFPAPMQGAKVEEGIIAALDKIAQNIDFWDVVVIIRGGGATSDLACFDSYDLANNCAQFPLPVITGIGHQRDDTILDIVAHARVKTPTAAAELLIRSFAAEAALLNNAGHALATAASGVVDAHKRRLASVLQGLPLHATLCMQKQHHRLDLLQQRADAASPSRILALGYSITRVGGKVVRSPGDVPAGTRVVTTVAGGDFTSIVEQPEQNK